MLTATHIKRYGILATYDRYCSIDKLFSSHSHDPYIEAEEMAYELSRGGNYDISVAIGADGKCVTQIILFRDKRGYELYVRDGITIFEHKEI